jgi:outer membrane protein OmpA-like peptidoglycan-associated protein
MYAEVGLTFNTSKTVGWNKTPDVAALQALSKSQLDALNAQLADEKAANDKLRDQLANQKPAETITQSIKELITTPVSVFFNLGKIDVASLKDMVNVQALAKYAKENNSKILVTGYADNATGSPAINKALSEKRANTILEELVKLGINRDNISTASYGGVATLSPVSFNRRATVQITE